MLFVEIAKVWWMVKYKEFGSPEADQQSATRALKALPLLSMLRQQIRRGAAYSLLVRLVGAEAEYRRLTTLYRLDVPVGAAQAPPTRFKAQVSAQTGADRSHREPLHGRQAR